MYGPPWTAGTVIEFAFSLLLPLCSLRADNFREWQQSWNQFISPLNPTSKLAAFVFPLNRHIFMLDIYILMDHSQYADDPDSALGEEV